MRTRTLIFIISAAIFIISCSSNKSEKEFVSLDNTTSGRPFSPAVRTGDMLFVSGQVAVDPSTGKLVDGGISEQTLQVLENMKAIIEESGFEMSDVVKCNVLLDTIAYYGPMNKVYMTFFPENPPARKAYAVESLPLGAMVEIDAIAVR